MNNVIITLLIAGLCSSCVSIPVRNGLTNQDYIRYESLDRSRASTFSEEGARLEMPRAISEMASASPMRALTPNNEVSCVSIGSSSSSIEIAMKKNMKEGDSYSCRNTLFVIKKCYDNCRSAIVNAKSDIFSLRMYVNECVGVLMMNFNADNETAKFSSPLYLNGDRGILASKTFPDCIR